MKIIEGAFAGSKARLVKGVLGGRSIEVRTGALSAKSYKLPDDLQALKLLNKDERRTGLQFVVILLLGITIVGLPIAALVWVFWKRIDFSVAVKMNDDSKFVAKGDAKDWKFLQDYIGIGELKSI